MRTAWGALGLAVLAVACGVAHAGEVNLSWDPSSGASGYRVFSGSSSGSYGSPQDVGSATTVPITTVPDCTTTYFAVTAYNGAGESGFSQEVSSWPRPVLSSINDPDAQRGESVTLVIGGANFQPGSSVAIPATGVVLNSATIDSCNQLTLGVSVQATAPFGPVEILVTNGSGVEGRTSALFSVVGNPLPGVENLRRTDTTN
ncbi:MAG TPA: hypothetical protein VD788_05020 [Candidatus Polarisedimenticolaceae bacterium]|nr:hypothetical protein [Candidatus Polarisedimenticolaceae bacterium]